MRSPDVTAIGIETLPDPAAEVDVICSGAAEYVADPDNTHVAIAGCSAAPNVADGVAAVNAVPTVDTAGPVAPVAPTAPDAPDAPLAPVAPTLPPDTTATLSEFSAGADAKLSVTAFADVATTSASTSTHVAASNTDTATARVPNPCVTVILVADPSPTNCEKLDPGGPTHGTPKPDAGNPDAPAIYNNPSAELT